MTYNFETYISPALRHVNISVYIFERENANITPLFTERLNLITSMVSYLSRP